MRTPGPGRCASGLLFVLGMSGCASPRVIARPAREAPATIGYGLWGPCASPDPSGRVSCAETSGDIALRIVLSMPSGVERATEALWREVIDEGRGGLEQCHVEAARLDASVTCEVSLIATHDDAGPLFQLSSGANECPTALSRCAAAALAGAGRSEQARRALAGTGERPTLFLYFAPSLVDPRATSPY